MNTLVQYATLATDTMKKGIAQTIYQESPWLRRMPFKPITGNALDYNMETTAASTGFYAVGDTWAESAPVWAQRTVSLAILGGDADVDEFVKKTLTQQDIKAAVIELKAKAIAQKFNTHVILGRTTSNATYASPSFKGMLRLIAELETTTTTDLDGLNNSQVLPFHATSATIDADALDKLLDLVKPKADAIIMTRRMRRKFNALCRASGNNLVHDKDQYGFPITRYGDQEIIIDDANVDNLDDNSSSVCAIASWDSTQARAGAKDNTPILAVRWGEDGVCGLSNGMIETQELGPLENKDAERTRIKFYCALAIFNKLAAAVMIGATDGL